jgi:hypothetical protein
MFCFVLFCVHSIEFVHILIETWVRVPTLMIALAQQQQQQQVAATAAETAAATAAATRTVNQLNFIIY